MCTRVFVILLFDVASDPCSEANGPWPVVFVLNRLINSLLFAALLLLDSVFKLLVLLFQVFEMIF